MPRSTQQREGVMLDIPISVRLRDFQYHKVDSITAGKMALVRAAYYQLAAMLVEGVPDSRERSLALTALEESSMRAIQCLAVSEGEAIAIGEVVT